jgi:hypothetical protein
LVKEEQYLMTKIYKPWASLALPKPEHPMPSDFNVLSGELTQFAEMQ